MVQITRDPSVLESAGELMETGAARAMSVLDAVAARAQEALESADFDPQAMRAEARRAVASQFADDAACADRVEMAEDRMRLRTGLVAAIVLFALAALVLLTAREIARRAERRRKLELQRREGSHGTRDHDSP